jgi:probable F420-dependent oxidoreductase
MITRAVPDERQPDLQRLTGPGAFIANLSRFSVDETRQLAASLESWGFKTLSYGESLGREAFTQAAVLLASSSTLVVATGIASIYSRDPWAMMNGARTLLEAYPGRFILGVGVSHPNLVTRRGHSYASPVAAMRSYLDAMPDAPWARPSPPEPRVVVAALRRGMLEVVRESADGTQPYFSPIEHTELARGVIGEDRWLCPILTCIVSVDPSIEHSRAQQHMRTFLRMTNYRENLRALGWPEVELEDAGSDRLLDALVVSGGPPEVKDRMMAQIKAGADHVQIEVLAGSFSELMAGYRALAPVLT